MNHYALADIVIPVTGLGYFVAEIEVLRIHEVIFAEQVNSFKYFATDHHAGSGDNVDLCWKRLIAKERAHSPQGMHGPTMAQHVSVNCLIQDGWERLYATRLNRKVAV